RVPLALRITACLTVAVNVGAMKEAVRLASSVPGAWPVKLSSADVLVPGGRRIACAPGAGSSSATPDAMRPTTKRRPIQLARFMLCAPRPARRLGDPSSPRAEPPASAAGAPIPELTPYVADLGAQCQSARVLYGPAADLLAGAAR